MEPKHNDVMPDGIRALSNALDSASGADPEIDVMIAELLDVEPSNYTADAGGCRRLCAELLPQGQLRVGYDVRGVLPSASIHRGRDRQRAIASTVPIAILQALVAAIAPQSSG